MEFSSDEEMQKASREAQEFFALILHDEQPLFVSDEATIWDVSTSTSDEILARCSKYYSKNLSVEDLKQPLWKLLQKLNEGRQTRYKWLLISRLFALIRGKISYLR
ncbi:MAG TPA: hypothetical protein VE176_04225 [Candidatus Limnocylindrales bacterium]|nr:hypothetical protein [Candidatus Limnocylindrales bacterium]